MGFRRICIEGFIRESIYRGLGDDVLLIGRQTIYQTPQETLALLHEHGIATGNLKASDIELDKSTISRHQPYDGSEGKDLIADSALFRLLGVPKVLALDHSDYEGAEIIHDLNRPVPAHLQGCANFVIDGSTLDNVFNAALALKNFADLLKPGGRLFTGNVYSNHYFPYSMVTPLWLLDYFVINGFLDCKVYIFVGAPTGLSVFTIDLDYLQDPARSVSAFVSPYIMATFVFAEKGDDSTTDTLPSQQHYRSVEEWAVYRRNLRRIQESARPHLVRSPGDISFFHVPGGHLFIANDFTAWDPQTAINKLPSSSR